MIFRNPETVHHPLSVYSHQAEVSGNARWLVLSAQIGMDKDGFLPEDVYGQVELALDNILKNLEAAGMGKENLVKLAFYFVGAHDIERRRTIVRNWLEGHQPCMTILFVSGLAHPSFKIEIDAWASG